MYYCIVKSKIVSIMKLYSVTIVLRNFDVSINLKSHSVFQLFQKVHEELVKLGDFEVQMILIRLIEPPLED